jgi:hypothetical protein
MSPEPRRDDERWSRIIALLLASARAADGAGGQLASSSHCGADASGPSLPESRDGAVNGASR